MDSYLSSLQGNDNLNHFESLGEEALATMKDQEEYERDLLEHLAKQVEKLEKLEQDLETELKEVKTEMEKRFQEQEKGSGKLSGTYDLGVGGVEGRYRSSWSRISVVFAPTFANK